MQVDFQTPEEPVIISSDSSDEQITIAQESGTIKYHDGNQKVPIFSAPKETLSAKEIFKPCFGDRFVWIARVGCQYLHMAVIGLQL
jgi:hypothetical protein